MTYPTNLRELALTAEMDLAIHLINEGLAAIRKIPDSSFGGPDYHVPILLISSGFERYGKCISCVNYLTDNGTLPQGDDGGIRRFNHNIGHIISKLIGGYDRNQSPVKSEPPDLDFLQNDPADAKFIKILIDFGEGGRYDYLDIILGKRPAIDKIPVVSFETLEDMLVKSDPLLIKLQSDPTKQEVFIQALNTKVVVLIEKMAKNIGKLIRYNSDAGAQVCILAFTFILTNDSALGRVDYS